MVMKTVSCTLKYNIAFVLITLINGIAFGQNHLHKAKQFAANFQYQKAIAEYISYFESTTPARDDARDLANCYIEINDVKSAVTWMGKVVSMDKAKPEDVKIYASLLKSEGNYKDAISQFQQYEKSAPEFAELTNAWILACQNAERWIESPEYIEVKNDSMFNSECSDFGLIPFYKGYLLTSDRREKGKTYSQQEIFGWTGNPYLKLYYVEMDTNGKSVSNMRTLNELNYKYHNGPGTYDTTNKMMYYTRTNMVKVLLNSINPDPSSWTDPLTSSDYTNRPEIFSAKFANNIWTEIKPFAYNKSAEYSVGHPAISADGKLLYFVSNMPGGFGGSDIYYCEKTDSNNWSKPKNLGSSINTSGNEVFPYVDPNGTLYFSSDGLPGMGGLDLFSAKGNKESWATPVNLRYPINSPKDDFSIFYNVSGKSGYFASNRDGGKGMDDIYSFAPSPPTNYLITVVSKEKSDNKSNGALKDVFIVIKNRTTGQIDTLPNNTSGIHYINANCKDDYEIIGTKDGYFTQTKNIENRACASRHDTVLVKLDFDKIVIKKAIVLSNIYYDYDKWNIRPDAAIELDKLVTILLENPQIVIELGSHTDSRGPDSYNMTLSQHRAESAVNYIISKGINNKRITAKGYGETVPLNRCSNDVDCSEEEFQVNRRTEFKVTKIYVTE